MKTALRIAVSVALILVLHACERPPKLVDINSLDDMKTLFDRDAGKPRLVLMLSPT
jgi:hypothetical protein